MALSHALAVAALRGLGVAVATGAVIGGMVGSANAAESDRFMSGWMPYWTSQKSLDSVVNHASVFSDVSPFWHDTEANGAGVRILDHMSGSSRRSIIAALRRSAPGVAIIPSVTDGTPAGHMASVLRNAESRSTLAAQLVALVEANGYDGIDLDFEHFAFSDGYSTWTSTRPAWVAFIGDLSARLHARGKLLAVAVPPMYNSGYTSSSGYWVYDFPRIGGYVDRLRVMAYDYSWDSPGPIAPLPWTRTVATYAASVVPPGKVQLGVPTYGRDWVRRRSDGTQMIDGTCPTDRSVPKGTLVHTAAETSALPGKLGLPASALKRDGRSGELVLTYSVSYSGTAGGRAVTCRVHRQAWLADGQSVADRAAVARQAGIRGIATWTIGGEAADQWALLGGAGRGDTRRQTIKLGHSRLDGSTGTAIVRGRVRPARPGVAVVLQARAGGGWMNVGTATTGPRGRFAVEVPGARPGSSVRYRAVALRGGGFRRALSQVGRLRAA